MIGLKTVFNYIKFANELINKIFFMFNGIKKYVVRIVCVIMLLLVQEEFYKLKYCSTVVYMVPRA